jgi:Mg2+ and Co2+ transporter CorA
VTSWFHIEGVNDTVLREFFARMKLNTGAPSNGGARRGGGKNGDDAVALFFKRHREPRLRFFGTHMYVAMQLLDRNDSEGDIPMVSDQQVSALFIPNRRILLTVSEYASPGTDFDRLRETLVQGSSACNHPNADATLLLAVLADKFMEDSFPLAEELGDYLELLAHALIMKPGLRYNIPADKVRTELWRMRRFALRTRRLTEILAEDPLQLFENARFQSFVAVVERQSSSLAELCGMHIEVHQTHKTNETLFTLTILTALIIPVQFLTGVYGMNFENMPELRTTYGYYVFWAAVPTLCTFTYLMLRRKGLIEDDSDIRITQLMPTEVVSAVSFISKRAKRRMRQVGVGAAYVAGGMAKGAKKAGGAVHVTIKSASPRFSGSGGGGGLVHAADAQGRVGVECSVNLSVVSVIFF